MNEHPVFIAATCHHRYFGGTDTENNARPRLGRKIGGRG